MILELELTAQTQERLMTPAREGEKLDTLHISMPKAVGHLDGFRRFLDDSASVYHGGQVMGNLKKNIFKEPNGWTRWLDIAWDQ